MATLQYETEGRSALDRSLTRTTRRAVEDAVEDPTVATIQQLAAKLGLGYRRTRTLLRAFGLRAEFKKWEKKNDPAKIPAPDGEQPATAQDSAQCANPESP